MILGSSENEAIAARLNLYARVHSEGIAACFDDLALRTDSDALMEAALYLTTRDVGSVLTDVRPENEDTVVDTELRSCLSRQVASWRITRGDSSVRIELKVNPRRTQLTPESSQ